jgi:hypothetical protein
MPTRRLPSLVGLLVALLPAAAGAQRAVTVRADNDAFNFWQLPWNRPDEEYTSGVRLTVEYAGVAAWARGIERALGACRETSVLPVPTVPATTCGSHSYALGQDIYTAVRPNGSPTPTPGGRPDAGVLWLSTTSRITRSGDLTELGWTVGVTGKPSLAESMQHLFHELAPSFNRPIAWGQQLPAEAVFAASLDRRARARVGAIEQQPHAGASLGNLLTEARVGVGTRVGLNLSHPWMTILPHHSVEIALVGDATVRAVARNEVLSGTLFRPSARVTPRPVVTEVQAGLRVRWRMLEAAWLAHQTGAEYTTRGAPHPWSTLEASWIRGR